MGAFFNEIMKGRKFIPAKMESLRQEFKSKPKELQPLEPAKELTLRERRQAQAARMRERKKNGQTISSQAT